MKRFDYILRDSIHSNLDLGVVLVSRKTTPKSRKILNQGFTNSDQNGLIKGQKRFLPCFSVPKFNFCSILLLNM